MHVAANTGGWKQKDKAPKGNTPGIAYGTAYGRVCLPKYGIACGIGSGPCIAMGRVAANTGGWKQDKAPTGNTPGGNPSGLPQTLEFGVTNRVEPLRQTLVAGSRRTKPPRAMLQVNFASATSCRVVRDYLSALSSALSARRTSALSAPRTYPSRGIQGEYTRQLTHREPHTFRGSRCRARWGPLKRIQGFSPETWLEPRPKSGLDCLTCAEFTRQQTVVILCCCKDK